MFAIYAYFIYLYTKGHEKISCPDCRHAKATERATKLRKYRYCYHSMTYDLGKTQFPKWAVGDPQGKWETCHVFRS